MLSSIDPAHAPAAVIFGLSGTSLTGDEKLFFADANPAGFILFARNCQNTEQVRALTDSLRDVMGRDVAILIDQEGGRVMRLKPPEWPGRPAAKDLGNSFLRDFASGLESVSQNGGAIADDLVSCGINVNCAPVLDVFHLQMHEAIGDRAFSSDPEVVTALGARTCQAFWEKGIVPVVKHIPGQGRATEDSHKELPVINASVEELEKSDFVPFHDIQTRLISEGLWGMVAHVIYKDIDALAPASCSRPVIWDIIRKKLGFNGLLLSDDLDMDALESYGDMKARAITVLRAGCDIALHCNGKMAQMAAIADKVPPMTEEAVRRYNKSTTVLGRLSA